VYNISPLSLQQVSLCSSGERIIADGGFIGGPTLLCPHREDRIAKQSYACQYEMMAYNEELDLNHAIIEHVNHEIKDRARVLTQRYKRKRSSQAKLMRAACMLCNRVRRKRLQYAMMHNVQYNFY
jgi:hypothetical protein